MSSFPAAGREPWGAAFLEPIIEQGVRRFLENGSGLRMEARVLGGRLVPILASDGKRGKASFAFPRGHYLYYPIYEIARSSRWCGRGVLRTALSPLEWLFFAAGIDKVVYVNHWLLVGGPPLRLGMDHLSVLVEELTERYPQHALVVSGVVPRINPELTAKLMQAGGRAVQSRVVHILDPRRPLGGGRMKNIRNTRTADGRLHRRFEDRRTEDAGFLARHSRRLSSLYGDIYARRHPGNLNPRYNHRFFELLVTSGIFRAAGWRGDNGLEAFNIQLREGGVIVWSAFGVDGSQPRSTGLLRLVAADDMLATEREDLVLNWGGGNAEFKRRRGAVPAFEYDVVFDRHLRPFKRLPWWLLQQGRARKNGAPLDPASVSQGEERVRGH
jgi:hypothetical protein